MKKNQNFNYMGLVTASSFVLTLFFIECSGGNEEKDIIPEENDPQIEEISYLDEIEEQGETAVEEDAYPDFSFEIPEGPENCPPPPYGTQVGDTIEPHQFISTENTLISLCDFYNDTSVKLLLIYATAGWCSVCHQESLKLPTYYNDYHGQGLEILAAVFEDERQNPATREYAQNYAQRYGFTFPTVVDNTFQMGIYFDRAATPMNMFVDLTNMKILSIETGFDYVYDSMRDEIEVYLSRISR